MGKRVIILNFHGIGKPARTIPADEEPYWISSAFFESILDFIRGRDDVQVTFDDSNSSDYEIAFPALKYRKIRAKIFVLAQQIGANGFLNSTQLAEMLKEGLAIGSHGMEHVPWPTLDGVKLDRELKIAKDRLEDIVGQPVTEAACPFGRYNRRVLGAVRKAGYATLYTSDDWPAQKSCWIKPRYTILRTHDLAFIDQIISHQPSGLDAAWPEIKLQLKRLR